MRLKYLLCLVYVKGLISLDDTSSINILQESSLNVLKTSNPSTGFVWYLISEQEEKVYIEDTDGMYTSGTAGYQNFTLVCTKKCNVGESLQV